MYLYVLEELIEHQFIQNLEHGGLKAYICFLG